MEKEQRDKIMEGFFQKCNFIGSKTIKVTEQDVQAIRECWERANEERQPPRVMSSDSEIGRWPLCLNCDGTGTLQDGPYRGGTCVKCNGLGRINPVLPNVKG